MTAPTWTLAQADCFDYLRTLEPSSVDLVICDPPFGCTQNAWDQPLALPLLWSELKRVCKRNTAIVLFADLRYAAQLVSSNPKGFRYDYVWAKNLYSGFLNAKRRPLRSHEHILVFYDAQPSYTPQMREGEPVHTIRRNGPASSNYGKQRQSLYTNPSGLRYPTSVLAFDAVHYRDKDRIHPTQKPLPLLRWLVRTFSQPGETVLDFCAGSAATGVAALAEGRSFVGCELDPRYYELAAERLRKACA